MPVFRFDRAFTAARGVKVFLGIEGGITRVGAVPGAKKRNNNPRQRTSELREELKSKMRELSELTPERRAAKRSGGATEKIEHVRSAKSKKQEIYLLKNELRAAKERAGRGPDRQAVGRLPDFVIIGAPKCGTTFLYHLLTKHPHVEPAAFKELRYFDLLYDKGTEWYRQCFPPPRQKDGRETITGEATPGYIFHPRVPQRMAKVVPQARLIALLRNPVDRTYSAYHHRVRNGAESRTFEAAVEAQFADPHQRSLSKSIYVDHLLRWSEFFEREQMLVVKSEDLSENTQETLKTITDFLDVPRWTPGASELGAKRNKGGYGQDIDPATRQRLEDYFEPHNRRLYEYLGEDFGW